MEEKKKRGLQKKFILIAPFIVVFCILGTVVYGAARRISVEMSKSAITNLSENCDPFL